MNRCAPTGKVGYETAQVRERECIQQEREAWT